ncbi:PEPxxWA-CTERM sorting domain-containing protein [Leptolyngbya sp. 15MV]|nr:PEPxxWA-CTERM sorting domain-containing protein [Leptolyngbya sp. 15MV]
MNALRTAICIAAAPLALAATSAQAATFQVDWSGAQFGNNASATGFFEFTNAAAIVGGAEPMRYFPDANVVLNSLAVTENGVTTTFAQGDFERFYFSSFSQLDFTRQLIGQVMGNGCPFGTFTGCGEGTSGDFNLFRQTFGAPNGTFYFELTGRAGNRMAVVSMAPLQAAVPEPATWAMMLLGFFLVGGALRQRKTQVSYSFA